MDGYIGIYVGSLGGIVWVGFCTWNILGVVILFVYFLKEFG